MLLGVYEVNIQCISFLSCNLDKKIKIIIKIHVLQNHTDFHAVSQTDTVGLKRMRLRLLEIMKLIIKINIEV